MAILDRGKDNPWQLLTPPRSSGYTIHVEEKDGKKVLVCVVGRVKLIYDVRCVDDLYEMLKKKGTWVGLGGADEDTEPRADTVEAWARDPKNPIGGWYGLKQGLRGRFAVYIPPLMEALGLCQLEHHSKHNRIRIKKEPKS